MQPPDPKAMPAVVMNLFYTGLGIARSLDREHVPVIGLTAQRGLYGNFTRCARVVRCADSKGDPQGLVRDLLELSQQLGSRAVLFPTRDHDLTFLDTYRSVLEPGYSLVIPSTAALGRCLDKLETVQHQFNFPA